MKSTITILISIFIMLTSLDAMSKNPEKFSPNERTIIYAGDSDGMMRLFTIDNPEDSLLLRTESRDVSREMWQSEDFRILTKRMLKTVLNPENTGVGIAAPQVGILCKIVILQRFDLEGEPFKILVNPEIISLSQETKLGPEGCLSIPGYRGEVPRSTEVLIRYIDGETFEKREEKICGFTAVIVQHETDHLFGKLYIDRINPETLVKASRDEVKKSYQSARK
jgi:peptide deformylase